MDRQIQFYKRIVRFRYKLNGKLQSVRIKIPINSDNDIDISSKGNSKKEIPAGLRREIKNALNDKKTRDIFIKDLISILNNYESNLDGVDKAHLSLEKISKHFDLKWTGENVRVFISDTLQKYIEIYEGSEGDEYYMHIDRQKIKISSSNQWIRARLGLSKKKKN